MYTIGIIGISENILMLIDQLITVPNYEVRIYNEYIELPDKLKPLCSDNPFHLISLSDLLIISRQNKEFFGFVIESLLSAKPVLLNNLASYSVNEIEELFKLSKEASTPVIPMIDEKILRLKDFLSQKNIKEIQFIHITIKGKAQSFRDKDFNFRLLILLIYFSGNSVRKIYSKEISINNLKIPVFLYFSFYNSYTAAVFFEPDSDENLINITLIENQRKATIEINNDIIQFELDRIKEKLNFEDNSYYLNVINQILLQKFSNNKFGLLELKDALNTFKKLSSEILE
jgi:hypothetical protein